MAKKIILITGCSSGIGLLTAIRLAVAGHIVYATMRDLNKQVQLLAEASKSNVKLNVLPLDVTNDESIADVVEQISYQHSQLDVLINNAGCAFGGAFEDLLESEIRVQLETNLFGTQKMIRQCLPLLRKFPAAKIINLSSIVGLCGIPNLTAYSTSKFALEGFSEGLRHELQPFNIYVTLIEPGRYKTNIWSENRYLAANYFNPSSHYFDYSQKLLAAAERQLDSMGNPMEVAKLIEKVINVKKPAMRYRIGWESHFLWFLRQNLPFDWYSLFLRKFLAV